MSGDREGTISLEIAESALRDAEAALENINVLSEFDGSDGLYGQDDDAPDPLSHDWAGGGGSAAASTVNGVTPRYFIQYTGEAYQPERLTDLVVEGYTHETGSFNAQAFRIVVWSPGTTGESRRVIESYYTRDM